MTGEQIQNLAAVIATAPLGSLHRLSQDVLAAWGRGEIEDDASQSILETIAARRKALTAPDVAAFSLVGNAPMKSLAAATKRRSVGSRPKGPEHLHRRRRWAAAGYLPPPLASAFTCAENAVLTVVAAEVSSRGKCMLPIGRIAALAGVGRTTVKRAIKEAVALGLITSTEWRIARDRNAPNEIKITSGEWRAWLAKRTTRGDRPKGGGVQFGTGDSIKIQTGDGPSVEPSRGRRSFGRDEGRAEPFLTPAMLRQGARPNREGTQAYAPRRNPHLAALDTFLGGKNG
jgi:hypothetical protein